MLAELLRIRLDHDHSAGQFVLVLGVDAVYGGVGRKRVL